MHPHAPTECKMPVFSGVTSDERGRLFLPGNADVGIEPQGREVPAFS